MSKILIVEDDRDIASLEKDYLEMSNFDVDIISDGSNINEQLENNNYSLILLDVMLPKVSGYDVCRIIRQKYDMPIIMVTAKSDSIDKIRVRFRL